MLSSIEFIRPATLFTSTSSQNGNTGLSRAKAGIVRRLSMVALRCTARHVLRGLAIVGPPCTTSADAFGANRGAPWSNPTNGGKWALGRARAAGCRCGVVRCRKGSKVYSPSLRPLVQ